MTPDDGVVPAPPRPRSPGNRRGGEPGAVERRLAAQFGGELAGREVPLVYPVTGSVVQYPFLPLLGTDARPEGGVDHDQLARYPAGFAEECLALGGGQMAIEVAGEHPVEGLASDGQAESVAHDRQPARQAGPRDSDHGRTLIDPDDQALEMPGQESRATGDVQRPHGRQAPGQPGDLADLITPAWPFPQGEDPLAGVPLVVLRCPLVIIGSRRLVSGERGRRIHDIHTATPMTRRVGNTQRSHMRRCQMGNWAL